MKIMVNGMQHDEALNTAKAIYERNPEQLIRETFTGCDDPNNFYFDTIGKMVCYPTNIWIVRARLENIVKKEGKLIAINFCRRIHGQTENAIPYAELKIPFIFSSEDFLNGTEPGMITCKGEIEYIKNEVKENKGLAILGQTYKDKVWYPVNLGVIDFLIKEVEKGVKGKIYNLKDFQKN